jgi:hypothetical protein
LRQTSVILVRFAVGARYFSSEIFRQALGLPKNYSMLFLRDYNSWVMKLIIKLHVKPR